RIPLSTRRIGAASRSASHTSISWTRAGGVVLAGMPHGYGSDIEMRVTSPRSERTSSSCVDSRDPPGRVDVHIGADKLLEHRDPSNSLTLSDGLKTTYTTWERCFSPFSCGAKSGGFASTTRPKRDSSSSTPERQNGSTHERARHGARNQEM